jgi:hypothetical protein
VVIALDAPDARVSVRDDLDRGVVQLLGPIVLGDVASVHIDDAAAEQAVAAAAEAVVAADLGDPSAQAAVDDAEGFELSWFATQELPVLLESL